MPTGAVGVAPAPAPAGGGGTNAFWQVTNLYSRKNKIQPPASLLGTGQIDAGGALDAVGFLRGVRLQVRTTAAGVGGTALTADGPANIFKYLGLLDTDGTPIVNPQFDGFSWWMIQRFFRPWIKEVSAAYDFSTTANSPSLSLFVQPEVRQQLGVLENTDTRQQYSWSHSLNTSAAVGSGYTTAPTIGVTAFVDVWAQPDVTDLEGVDNERIPPGVNLQTKFRKQPFTLNGLGSDNIFLSALTGNALRGILLIVRDSTTARYGFATGTAGNAPALGNPIQWMLDDRTLSIVDLDQYVRWVEDFYAAWGTDYWPGAIGSNTALLPAGVYVFPRFYDVGSMFGQGWLYTSNATAVSLETLTGNAGGGSPGTATIFQEEVYNVGPIDTSLLDL